MNTYASLLILVAVPTFVKGNDQCSEEAINACLTNIFRCICVREAEMKNATRTCCEKNFGKETFLEEMGKCAEEWLAEAILGCDLEECEFDEHCGWDKMDGKFDSYEYKGKPSDKEECKEKYWKDSMDYFDEQCQKETDPAMKEICQLCTGKK